MNRCEMCSYCTEKLMTAHQQIGLCIEPHTLTRDAAGNPKKQVRLWQQACFYFTPAQPVKENKLLIEMKRGRKVTKKEH